MSSVEFDVAVVGAGPAGSAVATLLSRRGLRVLLLERSRLPRPKLCGEFLSPEALSSVHALGAGPALERAGPAPIRRLRVCVPGAEPLERELPEAAVGISRLRLDEALADAAAAAGARILDGCRVTGWRPEGGGHVIDWSSQDGTRSASVRAIAHAAGRGARLGGRPEPADAGDWIAVQRHFRPRRGAAMPDAVELHAVRGAYHGIAPVEDGLVNACVLARLPAERGERSAAALFAAGAAGNEHLARRLAGLEPADEDTHGAARMGFVSPGPRSREVFELGDAAGMIAPACGDGMAMALRSAELAAPWMASVLEHGSSRDGALARYHAAWRSEFGWRLRLGRLVQEALLSPSRARLVVRAGRVAPSMLDWLFRATRGAPDQKVASSAA